MPLLFHVSLSFKQRFVTYQMIYLFTFLKMSILISVPASIDSSLGVPKPFELKTRKRSWGTQT